MNIVNIVNFIRSEEEYRTPKERLVETLKNQVALAHQYKFPITFLFQHDAFTKQEWVDMIEPADYIEIGMWLELNRGLIERAGCEWRGAPERTWEYYSHIDLTCGYTPEERKRIIDIAMEDFKRVFSEYPKTVGSWIIDAVSLEYMAKKYGVIASLNCKEQWLTDGYSLWGGYYNQAYYPCKNNMLSPAQSKEEQIPLPVFRMLGSDPVRQYDCAMQKTNGQGVITLEAYLPSATDPKFGGSNEEWTRWFFDQMLTHDSLTFGYAQAGQENPFAWSGQCKGYTMQMRLYKELSEKGAIKLMKVSDTAKWYREKYEQTPASVTEGETPDGEHGVWYCCKNYRAFLYTDKKCARIKDITVFDERYEERYLREPCTDRRCFYDNLPLVDSYRWGAENGEPSGLKFYKDGKEMRGEATMRTVRTSDTSISAIMRIGEDEVKIELGEDGIIIQGSSVGWCFADNTSSQLTFGDNDILLHYNGFERTIGVHGTVDKERSMIHPKDGYVSMTLKR